MNFCKACGNEIKYPKPNQLGDLCEDCFWMKEDERPVMVVEKKEKISANTKEHWDFVKRTIAKRNKYIISNKTLEEYNPLKAWGDFLGLNGFMVVRSDDEYSVIKKSIL